MNGYASNSGRREGGGDVGITVITRARSLSKRNRNDFLEKIAAEQLNYDIYISSTTGPSHINEANRAICDVYAIHLPFGNSFEEITTFLWQSRKRRGIYTQALILCY